MSTVGIPKDLVWPVLKANVLGKGLILRISVSLETPYQGLPVLSFILEKMAIFTSGQTVEWYKLTN